MNVRYERDFEWEPGMGPAAWRAADPRQLAGEPGVRWLDPRRIKEAPPPLTEDQRAALAEGRLTAVHARHPRREAALDFVTPKPGKKRVHLLAVGDVGGTLLTALKLLGGDVVSSIGICDLNEKTVARWVTEMGQIAWPWDYEALPEVEAVEPENLFDCDVFLFAAAKAIPPVGSAVQDVRMAQLEANRPLAEFFARQARAAGFRGLFVVLSDPVDPLCRAALLESNRNGAGTLDGRGLSVQQVRGFGLGVMDARARYYAGRDPRFADYLTDGRAFGPHGEGLVIANSVTHYDDALSRELTERTKGANLEMRALGYKPYAAPALSSGALSLLACLRGQWHCSSVYLDGVFFGIRNRLTEEGCEMERLPLPEALLARLRETIAALKEL